MHACCSCADPAPAESATAPRHARSRPGRVRAAVEWAVPVTALALAPKCPACVAAYVLLLTGVGLSFRAAAAARWCLIACSVAALAFLLLRVFMRGAHQNPSRR